ncbi:hypothetical protein BUALT_Bualt10G0073200 [Buddleja alternifolia]|uniref:F-box domain-containing protein n=1 Tax=Buddleja alternifolia TaxID=168488 RepID=A0AAV6X3D1_9LAMI|nr:hypothetical protein BUALT_Bualt10G0073200 [Buddleja alternifolia]
MNRSCIRRIGGVMEEDRKALTTVSQFCLMDLPTAVLHDILFRLPINSIINVKFVCRALYKLLSNPNFALNYSKHSPFATFLLPDPSVLLEPPNLNLLEICVDSHDRECIRTIFKPKIPDWSKGYSCLSVVGACNGLLCLSVYKWGIGILYICNPLTGECITVAEHIAKARQIAVVYGFGFCRSTNNYKILKIVSNSWGAPESREGEILTVGVDDRWRVLDRVANLTIPHPFDCFNLVIVNEAFHWIVSNFGPTWISTFDLEEEKMGQLSHPHGLELNFACMKLTSTNNQLCLLDGSSPDEIVIWKMKEYGVAESWTKDMVLDISVSQVRVFSLVRILENGDLLSRHPVKGCSISYNPSKRELIEIKIPGLKSIDCSPSFLSLKELMMGGHSSTINMLSK